jgi:hypothetical protein
MKTFLFLFINVMMVVSLLGCEQQAEESIKDQIQTVPNEDYVGEPHPTIEAKIKLTDEEKVEFEKLQKEIQSKNEVE